ncbi:hypothetical protein PHMEG_00024939 [Phytophthora megakarya]|uniref:Transmembrane protein n=1 Tax=Phytophthora megakarya TaxID=4795 RepID=A0A225VEX4_9STRA|nr:hypothetical protein PHMEG_00024939 [Phytophthora megakarya]
MLPGKVHALEEGPHDTVVRSESARAQYIITVRSYLKFVTPHKITGNLIVPMGIEKKVSNLIENCPVKGMLLSGSWFNIDPTHYYVTRVGRICHYVLPQYNAHGNYLMGNVTVEPYYTTPSSCINDSVAIEQYFYHGSIGFYSFYEEQDGTYCSIDNTAYIVGVGLGSFDINGVSLAEDTGFEGYRSSYWFGITGAIWIAFRALVLRRCYVTVKRYGYTCQEMGEYLSRKEAVIFVQENLRLIAHGATNCHRAVVLYLLIEGFMADVFLLVANDGLFVKLQYASMGYNLSALLLLVFEMIENTKCLPEKWRMFIKRLLFSYETAFLGELVSAAVQQRLLTLLNRTNLRESRPIALAVSYYAWALVGHGIFVLNVIGFLIGVRVLFATLYVRLEYGTFAVFLAPCSVDTTLKLRNKMVMLGGYRWKNKNLLYTTSAMKAFGLQKMVDNGTEFVVLRKLYWFTVPTYNLCVIGIKNREGVLPCVERLCTGVVSFFEQDVGGDGRVRQSVFIRVRRKVLTDPISLNHDRVQCLEHGSHHPMARVEARINMLWTADRMLIGAWVFIGLIPYILMIRSYLNFVTPHKITETLVIPLGVQKQTENLPERCPIEGFFLGQVWWNVELTHYYTLPHGYVCHYVVPQYNIHGNFHIGDQKTTPYKTTPHECDADSYPYQMYLYHGSFGYFSFYEEQIGSYCARDKTAYIVSQGLGTFDINGHDLVEDTGSTNYRKSYWYGIIGAIWVVYRGLVLRRSYVICKRYGQRCRAMGVKLRRKEAVVFVHEQLRLTGHNATKLHRVVLIYLLIEGLMGDLFLLIANNGFLAKIQYVSLGYNLSGMLLLVFEIIESANWLRESTRVFFKRLLFCYESSLLGEIVGAALQQPFLTQLNGSRTLKRSNNVNLAVSHYVWSIVGHSIFVICVIGFIMMVRALWAIVYVMWKHQTLAIFSEPCCVDTAMGRRNKMTMLGGYRWSNGKLYYKPDALKSFGLVKMEDEDNTEYIALRKLYWFAVPRNDLFVIGMLAEDEVKPCSERPCTGLISFFDRMLGGDVTEPGGELRQLVFLRNKIAPGSDSINILPLA